MIGIVYKKQYHDPQWLKDIVQEYLKPKSLNLCCGMSKFGDVRIDIDPKVNPDIVMDMWDITKHFDRASFDSIYCDPVWESIPIKKRYGFMWLLRDLLKSDGILIWNCNWAFPNLKGFKLIYNQYNHSKYPGTITCTMVYKKINCQLEEFIDENH